MSPLNEFVAGAAVLGAYAGVCAAIFNHTAGAKLPFAKYALGGAIALGGLTALGSGAIAAEVPQIIEKTPVSAPAAPVMKP